MLRLFRAGASLSVNKRSGDTLLNHFADNQCRRFVGSFGKAAFVDGQISQVWRRNAGPLWSSPRQARRILHLSNEAWYTSINLLSIKLYKISIKFPLVSNPMIMSEIYVSTTRCMSSSLTLCLNAEGTQTISGPMNTTLPPTALLPKKI